NYFARCYLEDLDEPEANSQIDKLAYFIMSEVEGEPSQNQGAVDTAIRIIKSYQNQEVLSQEFIDEYKVDYDNWMPAVPIVHLQNLLVPKQERLTIPNYVAKWISEHHEKFDLYPALRRLEEGSTRDYDAYKWYRKNTRKFVNAYLTGE